MKKRKNRKGKTIGVAVVQAFLFILTRQGPQPRLMLRQQARQEETWEMALHRQLLHWLLAPSAGSVGVGVGGGWYAILLV